MDKSLSSIPPRPVLRLDRIPARRCHSIGPISLVELGRGRVGGEENRAREGSCRFDNDITWMAIPVAASKKLLSGPGRKGIRPPRVLSGTLSSLLPVDFLVTISLKIPGLL
jgi:hypothetical protein